jgi:hypothetical protein
MPRMPGVGGGDCVAESLMAAGDDDLIAALMEIGNPMPTLGEHLH